MLAIVVTVAVCCVLTPAYVALSAHKQFTRAQKLQGSIIDSVILSVLSVLAVEAAHLPDSSLPQMLFGMWILLFLITEGTPPSALPPSNPPWVNAVKWLLWNDWPVLSAIASVSIMLGYVAS